MYKDGIRHVYVGNRMCAFCRKSLREWKKASYVVAVNLGCGFGWNIHTASGCLWVKPVVNTCRQCADFGCFMFFLHIFFLQKHFHPTTSEFACPHRIWYASGCVYANGSFVGLAYFFLVRIPCVQHTHGMSAQIKIRISLRAAAPDFGWGHHIKNARARHGGGPPSHRACGL